MPTQTNLEEQKIIDRLESEDYDKVWIYDAPPEEAEGKRKHEYGTKLHILTGDIRIKLLRNGIITDFRLDKEKELDIPRDALHSYKIGQNGCRYIVAEKH